MHFDVYLSGEIHSDWREQIIQGCTALELPVSFSSAVTNHEASDAAGDVLGVEESGFWRDHKSSKVNGIRTKSLIERCDVAVVRFGDKYKQWNAAFDAGYASALGKSVIIMHQAEHAHALKEVDAAALAVVDDVDQIIDILRYVIRGELDVGRRAAAE